MHLETQMKNLEERADESGAYAAFWSGLDHWMKNDINKKTDS